MLTQDYRDRPDNDGCPKHHFSVCRNGVMDTRDWHILWGVPPKYDVEPLRKLVFAGLPLELYEFLSRGHRNNKKTHHEVSFFCYWWSQRDLNSCFSLERAAS